MQPDMITRLNRAIDLINAGRRAEAKPILLELSQQYPNAEQIWMWLSAASDNSQERIRYLRRVLSINPQNNTARAALLRLTQETGGEAPMPGASRPAPARRPPNTESTIIGILLAILVIVVVVVITVLVANANQPKPTPTPTRYRTPTITPTRTDTPTITPGGPTLTPVVGVTYPASWTPVATETQAPTHTKIPRTQTPTPSLTFTPKATFTWPPTITPGGPSLTPAPTSTPYPTDLVSWTPSPEGLATEAATLGPTITPATRTTAATQAAP